MPTWKPDPNWREKIPGDYPMVPPGVHTFSPRRLRRYLGLTEKWRRKLRAAQSKKERDKQEAAVRRTQAKQRQQREQSFVGKATRVLGKIWRWIGRGRKQ